jgi:plastocyanin
MSQRRARHIALAVLALGALTAPRVAPRTHRVTISALRFKPPALKVAAGDTVEWVNQDIVPHSATADDHGFDSKDIAGTAHFRWVAVKGRHPYRCSVHPDMRGVIEAK